MDGLNSNNKVFKISDLFLEDRDLEIKEIGEVDDIEIEIAETLLSAENINYREEFIWHPKRRF